MNIIWTVGVKREDVLLVLAHTSCPSSLLYLALRIYDMYLQKPVCRVDPEDLRCHSQNVMSLTAALHHSITMQSQGSMYYIVILCC